MKTLYYLIVLLLSANVLSAQTESKLKKIDSIKKYVLTKKNLDSVYYANVQFALGRDYRRMQKSDSAYYHLKKAEKIYRSRSAKFNIAEVLYEYAILQKNDNDLTGSELTSVEVLQLCDELDQTEKVIKLRADTFYNLAAVFFILGEFDKSLEYIQKSIDTESSIPGYSPVSIAMSKNVMALNYQKSGRYKEAIRIFKEILDSKAIPRSNNTYVVQLCNYAYAKFLSGDNSGLPDLYYEALKLSDSINPGGAYKSIMAYQYLAEYYNKIGVRDSALHFAYEAKDLSERFHEDQKLTSLKLLSEVETGDTALKYLKEYVRLNDSIQKEERSLRNKSARIRYETKEKEQQLAEVSKERLWLLFISIGVILTSILIYIVITQRNKNKELKFIQEQQEANEEIYNLMLNQSDNIEEARAAEKKRISEELHDGVLGRLFGTRLSLDSLNMNNSPEAIKTRSQYIEGLKTIEQDIRKVSHELNTDFVSGGGFKDIIKTLVDTQCLAYGLKYTFTHDDDIDWDSVPNKTKIHFYRIIQETLHNIYKHAKASAVKINFKRENNNISLLLSDDGAGFDVSKAKSGIGLKNMNSRIKEIGGKIHITSKPGKGTTVTIEAPKN